MPYNAILLPYYGTLCHTITYYAIAAIQKCLLRCKTWFCLDFYSLTQLDVNVMDSKPLGKGTYHDLQRSPLQTSYFHSQIYFCICISKCICICIKICSSSRLARCTLYAEEADKTLGPSFGPRLLSSANCEESIKVCLRSMRKQWKEKTQKKKHEQ